MENAKVFFGDSEINSENVKSSKAAQAKAAPPFAVEILSLM